MGRRILSRSQDWRRAGKLLAAWAPAVLWMLLIFTLSAIPEVPDQAGLPHARDRLLDDLFRCTAHVVEYAILANLVWLAAGRRPPALWLAAVWSLVYAASDELHQSFVAGRTCSFQDWLLDAAGVLLAVAFLKLYRRGLVGIHHPVSHALARLWPCKQPVYNRGDAEENT